MAQNKIIILIKVLEYNINFYSYDGKGACQALSNRWADCVLLVAE